jgi:hypothetical protein
MSGRVVHSFLEKFIDSVLVPPLKILVSPAIDPLSQVIPLLFPLPLLILIFDL